MTYMISFDRVGRNHDVPDLVTECTDPDDIAEQVYRIARKNCGSREIEVLVDLEELKGHIIVGGAQSAGKFTITEPAGGAS